MPTRKRDRPGDASPPPPKAPARGARRGMPSPAAPAPDNGAPSSAAAPITEASPPPSTLGDRGLVDRREYVRLLQQTLSDDLGLPALASALAEVTGVAAEEGPAAALRAAAGEGAWEEVPRLVGALGGGARGARAARWVAAREAVLEVRIQRDGVCVCARR